MKMPRASGKLTLSALLLLVLLIGVLWRYARTEEQNVPTKPNRPASADAPVNMPDALDYLHDSDAD